MSEETGNRKTAQEVEEDLRRVGFSRVTGITLEDADRSLTGNFSACADGRRVWIKYCQVTDRTKRALARLSGVTLLQDQGFIMPGYPGSACDPQGDEKEKASAIAECLLRFWGHRAGITTKQYLKELVSQYRMEQFILRAKGQESPALRKVEAFLEQSLNDLVPGRLGLVHGDLKLTNLILSGDGECLHAELVDLENVHFGDPAEDLVNAAVFHQKGEERLWLEVLHALYPDGVPEEVFERIRFFSCLEAVDAMYFFLNFYGVVVHDRAQEVLDAYNDLKDRIPVWYQEAVTERAKTK